jgi:cold shock protein
MTEKIKTIICRRCGRCFVLTTTYLGRRARWDAEVVEPVLCPTCFWKNGPLPKRQGHVKWFNPHKHYGFIIAGEEEIFFHQQQIVGENRKNVRTGQTVQFHVRHSKKGPEALNVELAED